MPRTKKTKDVNATTIEVKTEIQNIEFPKIKKGSHLTVYTYENGTTRLEWDDAALMRDVQKALTDYENSVKVNNIVTKPKRKKKNET